MRGRLGHNGCIVRLTGADSQQGSHNLCELACHKAIALMIAERKRKVAMEMPQACDGPTPAGALASMVSKINHQWSTAKDDLHEAIA